MTQGSDFPTMANVIKQISEHWLDKHKSACLRALNDLTEGLDALNRQRDQ